jgi:hypothetical protein
MQILLDKCQNFSDKWNIKFNVNKSVVIYAGFKMYQDEDIYLFINHMKLNVVVESKYLGLIINKTNDGNEPTLLKYNLVEKCFFLFKRIWNKTD